MFQSIAQNPANRAEQQAAESAKFPTKIRRIRETVAINRE